MKKALIFAGGWEGHHPIQIADRFAGELQKQGIHTEIALALDVLDDEECLKSYSLIFPCWTVGQLSETQGKNLQNAVRAGAGLGGIHGGMGDAFRANVNYLFMVGGQFVGHPHVGDYQVTIRDQTHPVTNGLPESFAYHSEQYYMLVDPGVHLLADTQYQYEGRSITMPVAWVKPWGKGRVFYSALGHEPEEFDRHPQALTLTMQGLLWASGQY